MRIARVLLPSFSAFDLKCFRLDRETSGGTEEASWTIAGPGTVEPQSVAERQLPRELRDFAPSILHVYGTGPVPQSLIAATDAPWLADRALEPSRSLFGRRPRGRSKSLFDEIPEPVAIEFLGPTGARPRIERPTIGALCRGAATATHCQLTDARIRRFRDDVAWKLFEAPPQANEMSSLSLWLDPTNDEDDLDGFVCEAIALGVPVVAARTAANRRRSDDGRAAALCPKKDPNEMAHAIVTTLFKPELAAPLLAAAAEIRDRFHPAHRRQALLAAYAEAAR
ncbi:MAG: glycosyltransferase [Thermoanaerobaculia bacterium]